MPYILWPPWKIATLKLLNRPQEYQNWDFSLKKPQNNTKQQNLKAIKHKTKHIILANANNHGYLKGIKFFKFL